LGHPLIPAGQRVGNDFTIDTLGRIVIITGSNMAGKCSFLRALAGGHGVGFIATHDLELVKLADENALIHNYHFRDAVVDGRMVFDYKLHPGPCPTTNALKIMALAGLPL
jgi:DNA mismatch repair ATPase MutS